MEMSKSYVRIEISNKTYHATNLALDCNDFVNQVLNRSRNIVTFNVYFVYKENVTLKNKENVHVWKHQFDERVRIFCKLDNLI